MSSENKKPHIETPEELMPPKIDKWDGLSIVLTILFLFLFMGGSTPIAVQAVGVTLLLAVLYGVRIFRRMKSKQVTGPLDDVRQLLGDSKTRLSTLITLGLVIIIYYRIFTGALIA